jgi:hypothetical protein
MNAIHDAIFKVLATKVPEFKLFISIHLFKSFISKTESDFHT